MSQNKQLIAVIMLVMVLFLGFHFISDEPTYELSWEDHFGGEVLDAKAWTYARGNGCPDLCGWGNNELQKYTSNTSNIRIQDGKLIIEARKDSIDEYSSSKIFTKNKLDWKYGRVEIRAKLPTGRGTWMAFWMLPTLDRKLEWPKDGEIDIVEHVGYNPNVIYGTIHTNKYNGMIGTQKVDSVLLENVSDDFHIYAIEWSEDEIKWFVDDQKYNHLRKGDEDSSGWPFNQYDYHLIINLAIGGDWGGKMGVDESAFPQRMEIDYVKYYKSQSN